MGDREHPQGHPGGIEPRHRRYDLRITRDGVEPLFWGLFELDQDGIWRLVTF